MPGRSRLHSTRTRVPARSASRHPSQISRLEDQQLQRPVPGSHGWVLGLQRTAGNAAVARNLSGPNLIRRKGGWLAAAPTKRRERARGMKGINKSAPAPEEAGDRARELSEGVSENTGLLSEPLDVVGSTLGNYGAETAPLGDYNDANKISIAGQGDRENLGIASSAGSTVTSGLSTFASFAGFVASLRAAAGTEDQLDKLMLRITAGGQATQGLLGVGAVGSNLTSTIAGGVAKSGNSTAEGVSTGAGGVTESLGALSGVVDMVMSGAKITTSVIHGFKDGWNKDIAASVLEESVSTLKGFFLTAGAAIRAAGQFVDVFGGSAEFLNAVPVVGAVVNIVVQAIDVLQQVIAAVKAVYKIVKSRLTALKLKERIKTASGERLRVLQNLYTINMKRMRRAIIPLVSAAVKALADVISIGASVLNIIGVATSAAYGAGVAIMATGYGLTALAGTMKAGAALAGPTAALIRKTKQFGRNKAAKNPQGRLAKVFNADKSTAKKQAQYEQDTKSIVKMMTKLPPYKEGDSASEQAYGDAYLVLKATGVQTKELFQETDNAKKVRMILDALAQRD
ncbi:MAG: hypothetical protein ACM3S1_15840 [Hyphomicrobiales bacterium]